MTDLIFSLFLGNLPYLCRRTAVSKSNGKICRITVELLSRHLQNEGIVEYGFKTLSFLLFVAVSVELKVLQRASMGTSNANIANTKNSKGSRCKQEVATTRAEALFTKSTTQYMQEAEAVQLAAKALLGLTNPDGTITSTARAAASVLLAIGNLCHSNQEGKLFVVSHTHNIKRFHLTGKSITVVYIVSFAL